MSIERSFPPCKRKKLSKKSWWMLSRYRVIQILRPVFSYPPYHWYAFQDFYELLWRGDWFFSFRTRNTSGSAKPTNHKLEIRYPYTFYARRFVSIAGVIAIHLYFAFCNYIGAAKREEGRRRRRRSKKNSKKKKEEDPCSFLRWLWIYSWIEERFTLHVGTHYSYGSEKTNANVVMLRHVKGEDLDVR